MSKPKLIIDIYKFLIEIDKNKELKKFPKLQLKAKSLKWDLEEIFHFSASQQAVENGTAENHTCTCRTGVFKYGFCVNCGGSKSPSA